VLPTKDEPRWIQDETRFNDALKDTDYSAEIMFSQGDPAREKQNVETLIGQGIKVLFFVLTMLLQQQHLPKQHETLVSK